MPALTKTETCQRVSVEDAAREIGCDKQCLRIMMKNRKWDLGVVVPPNRAGGPYKYLIFRAKLDKFLGLAE